MDYASAWNNYAFNENGHKAATLYDLKNQFDTVDLSEKRTNMSGPVLYAEGDCVTVNNADEHWLCVGETGSKKTRCFVRPLLYTLAKARESAVITDVKGELAADSTVREMMRQNHIKGIYLDFRNFAGDCYDIFDSAYEYRLRGDVERAHAEIMRMVNCLVSPIRSNRADPFWERSASQYLCGVLQYLLEVCTINKDAKKYFNMMTLARFIDTAGNRALDKIVLELHKDVNDATIQTLRGVVNTYEKTRASISATVNSVVKDYLSQTSLLKMLSSSSFDTRKLYSEPTFVFLIIPDENSAYSEIAGQIIDSMYGKLIDTFTNKYQNRIKPECRINWVCDEFCNVKINDMLSKISASRSRDMRFFIVIQSIDQMNIAYYASATTILGNCKNLLFLQSSDENILAYVSRRSGTTHFSMHPEGEYLVSIDELKRLKKTREYRDAYFMRDDFVFKTRLPDGDLYPCVKEFVNGGNVGFKDNVSKIQISVLSALSYLQMLDKDELKPPYPIDYGVLFRCISGLTGKSIFS